MGGRLGVCQGHCGQTPLAATPRNTMLAVFPMHYPEFTCYLPCQEEPTALIPVADPLPQPEGRHKHNQYCSRHAHGHSSCQTLVLYYLPSLSLPSPGCPCKLSSPAPPVSHTPVVRCLMQTTATHKLTPFLQLRPRTAVLKARDAHSQEDRLLPWP